MKAQYLFILFLAVVLTVGFAATGCSGKSDLLKEVSGTWQDNKDQTTVDIQLAGDTKSMTVDGKSYPVTVEQITMINYQVVLKVQNGGTEPETWSLRQVWDENGSSFKLAFNHNGESNVLTPKQQS